MESSDNLQSKDITRLVEEQLSRLGSLDSWGEIYSQSIRKFLVDPRVAPIKRTHFSGATPCCSAWVVIEDRTSRALDRVIAYRPTSREWILAEEGESGHYVALVETSNFLDALGEM